MQKQFFSKNVFLRTKFDLRLKKNKKFFGANFQNYLGLYQKMPVLPFPKMEIVWKAIFSKNKF